MKDQVVKVLQYFVARKQTPQRSLLRILGKMNFLSNDVYGLLREFDYRTENVDKKERTVFDNEIPGADKKIKEALDIVYGGKKVKKRNRLF